MTVGEKIAFRLIRDSLDSCSRECVVCYGTAPSTITLPCGHLLCASCLIKHTTETDYKAQGFGTSSADFATENPTAFLSYEAGFLQRKRDCPICGQSLRTGQDLCVSEEPEPELEPEPEPEPE